MAHDLLLGKTPPLLLSRLPAHRRHRLVTNQPAAIPSPSVYGGMPMLISSTPPCVHTREIRQPRQEFKCTYQQDFLAPSFLGGVNRKTR